MEYTESYKGTLDIFFGIEHGMRREELEKPTERPSKDGGLLQMRARITGARADGDDRKHTSGGAFVAVDSSLEADTDKEEGAVKSIPKNEGRIAQAWVNVRGGRWVVAIYF